MNDFVDFVILAAVAIVLINSFKGFLAAHFKSKELALKEKEMALRYAQKQVKDNSDNQLLDAFSAKRESVSSEDILNALGSSDDASSSEVRNNKPLNARPQATKVVPVRDDKEWEVYYEPAFIRKGKSIEGVAGSSRSSEKTSSSSKKRPSNPKAMMRDFKNGINHQSI